MILCTAVRHEMSTHIDVDIIILSFAKNDELRKVTETALASLACSEPDSKIIFHVIVIESNHAAAPYAGNHVKTIYLDEAFNYHRFMNHGISITESPYVAICNNDLFFHPGWVSALLQAFHDDPKLLSASPICGLHHPAHGYALDSGVHIGYAVRGEIAGWCLFFKRRMLDVTGPLDEQFFFWYADNDYAKTLETHGIRHGLVTTSRVDHLESQTLETASSTQRTLLTQKAKYIYQRKWEGKSRLYVWRKMIQMYLKLHTKRLSNRLKSIIK